MRALNSQGRFGILDIYLRRGLLWQRDQVTLERITFSGKERQGPVPSWSWMAFAGDIKYMNVPFGGVDWDPWEQDIISPWKDPKNENPPLKLEVLVRNLKDIRPGAMIFRDEPGRTFKYPFKCVVVGSSNARNQSKGQVYYVLIVTPSPFEKPEVDLYERAGVGVLHRQQIGFEEPAMRGWVC